MTENTEEIVVRGGLSTRPRRVQGADYMECCSKEALEDAVRQVRDGFVVMNVEHLSFLPPVGIWHRAEVENDADGHSELIMYGRYLEYRQTADSTLEELRNPVDDGPPTIAGVKLEMEPRNFVPDVWKNLVESSPLPVAERASRSSLPPLIWVLSVPVTWVSVAFTGSFLKRLGEEAADGLVGWLKQRSRLARGSGRDALVQVNFEVKHVTVSAFVPFDEETNDNVNSLRDGLEELGPVASFAGWMNDPEANTPENEVRLVSFFYDEGKWRLAWWATSEAAYLTRWFNRNCPDPQRFLHEPRLRNYRQS